MAVSLGHTQGLVREHFLYSFILHSIICATHISVNKRNEKCLRLHACIIIHWHSHVARLDQKGGILFLSLKLLYESQALI